MPPATGVSGRGEERGRGDGGGQLGDDGSRSSERGRSRGRGSRPPLMKQASTELQAAYHQVYIHVHGITCTYVCHTS